MSDHKLFEDFLNQIHEPSRKTSFYLEEAKKCFVAEAHRAAIVMAWCAIIERLRQEVNQTGFPIEHKAKDSDLLKTCVLLGIISRSEKDELEKNLEQRNKCAHPSVSFGGGEEDIEEKDMLSWMRRSVELLLGRTPQLDQSGLAYIVKNDKVVLDEKEALYIIQLIPDPQVKTIANDLLSIFLSSEFRIRRNILRVWPPLKGRLERADQIQLMRRLANELALSLGFRVVEFTTDDGEPAFDLQPLDAPITRD